MSYFLDCQGLDIGSSKQQISITDSRLSTSNDGLDQLCISTSYYRVYHIEMARNQVSDQKKSLEPDLNSETQTTKIPKVMVNINEASDANKDKNCYFGSQKEFLPSTWTMSEMVIYRAALWCF